MNFQTYSRGDFRGIFRESIRKWMPYQWQVSTGSGIGAVSQQAVTLTNVDPDLCRHMASLGHNELSHDRRDTIFLVSYAVNVSINS